MTRCLFELIDRLIGGTEKSGLGEKFALKSRNLNLCYGFFFGRGALQDMYREWPTSRFAAA